MLENMDDIWNIVMLTRTPLTLLIIHHLMGGGAEHPQFISAPRNRREQTIVFFTIGDRSRKPLVNA